MKKCLMCGEETDWVVNIKLNPKPLCNECANTIMLQQIHYLSDKIFNQPNKSEEKDAK